MVLFIDPHQKVLLVVVPNATCVRPVTCHTRACQKWRYRLVKQEVIADQLFLFLLAHSNQWIISARKVTWEHRVKYIPVMQSFLLRYREICHASLVVSVYFFILCLNLCKIYGSFSTSRKSSGFSENFRNASKSFLRSFDDF